MVVYILYRHKSKQSLHPGETKCDEKIGKGQQTFALAKQVYNIKLNDKELNYLKDEKHFKDSILKPFSDKENLLYGQYELINEKYSDNHYSIILTGFLKKPEDGYLPDTENHFCII